MNEMCHVDVVLRVMGEEQETRSRDDRAPDLNGMSLAEVGLALKSHLLAPRSGLPISVENFVLRHTGVERGGISKDILPFPLSFCPTAAEISLSVNARKAQTRLANGAEVSLDGFIQEAGLEAWTFLVTWAFNFVYCNRHAEQVQRPESLSAAQAEALAQLKKHIREFPSGPAVPQKDWASELASTKIDYY